MSGVTTKSGTRKNPVFKIIGWTISGFLNSGQNLAAGTVLGIITASSDFSAYDNGHSDGTEVAVGILLDDCDAINGDKECSIVMEGVAIKARLTGLDANAETDIAIAETRRDDFKFLGKGE